MPVIQALCVTMSRERWEEGGEGLLPVDAATQVAIPEFDGRIIGGPISFKERDAVDSPVGVAGPALRRRPRALRPARARSCCATRGCATRRRAARSRSSSPRSRPSTRASAWRSASTRRPARSACCTRCATTAIDVRDIPDDGDALMHALIAAGGHDPEFLTDEILAAAPLRIAGGRLPRLVRHAAGRS